MSSHSGMRASTPSSKVGHSPPTLRTLPPGRAPQGVLRTSPHRRPSPPSLSSDPALQALCPMTTSVKANASPVLPPIFLPLLPAFQSRKEPHDTPSVSPYAGPAAVIHAALGPCETHDCPRRTEKSSPSSFHSAVGHERKDTPSRSSTSSGPSAAPQISQVSGDFHSAGLAACSWSRCGDELMCAAQPGLVCLPAAPRT